MNILTNDHGGTWVGLIINKKQYLIQPGDLVNVSWSSRIPNQLGFLKIELIETTVLKFLMIK